MNNIPRYVEVWKSVGETPLEALERFRVEKMISDLAQKEYWQNTPMTYAGRLDPMAEGVLLILIGEECKYKEKYLGLDKEYEVEIIFGISTDSYDALGLITTKDSLVEKKIDPTKLDLEKYVGKLIQEYPPYSSKTVGGKQLHELSRTNNLPEEIPNKEVEIYSIKKINESLIKSDELLKIISDRIDLVKGDFRQIEIKDNWKKLLDKNTALFPILKIKVKCSSGTYMRSLAHRIGQDLGSGAFALSIKRTRINII